MTENKSVGRVTIPTDLDVVPETLEIMKHWGADATRDDIKHWWEVMDRTTGEPVSTDKWHYDAQDGCMVNNTYEPQSTTVYTDKGSLHISLVKTT